MERPTSEHICHQPPQPPAPLKREIRGLPREQTPTPGVSTQDLDLEMPGLELQAQQQDSTPASASETPINSPEQAGPVETGGIHPILKRKKAVFGSVAAVLLVGGMGSTLFRGNKAETSDINTPAASILLNGEKSTENPSETQAEQNSSIRLPQRSHFEAILKGEGTGTDEASMLIKKAGTQRLSEHEINRLHTLREKDVEGLRNELEKSIIAQREVMEQQILQQRANMQTLSEQKREEMERRIQEIRVAADQLVRQSRAR